MSYKMNCLNMGEKNCVKTYGKNIDTGQNATGMARGSDIPDIQEK